MKFGIFLFVLFVSASIITTVDEYQCVQMANVIQEIEFHERQSINLNHDRREYSLSMSLAKSESEYEELALKRDWIEWMMIYHQDKSAMLSERYKYLKANRLLASEE